MTPRDEEEDAATAGDLLRGEHFAPPLMTSDAGPERLAADATAGVLVFTLLDFFTSGGSAELKCGAENDAETPNNDVGGAKARNDDDGSERLPPIPNGK